MVGKEDSIFSYSAEVLVSNCVEHKAKLQEGGRRERNDMSRNRGLSLHLQVGKVKGRGLQYFQQIF